ncbi:MAG TPA: hypothetical protein VFF06_09640 [Polyangia bacterium]|nr:hypothetical protein [Polyangia bacterium]
MAGADALITTDGASVENAEIGLSVRADARDLAKRVDLRLDFRGREGIQGNSSANELYELSATIRLIDKRLDLKVGRFPAPGGYWLILDGAMLRVHYTSWLTQSVYGGLRSFTTGRRNTWMSNEPLPLPLVGTQIAFTHRIVQASIGFTWARDGIDLHEGEDEVTGQNLIERHIDNEYFLDGQVSIFPTEKLTFSAGATVGTRYDVQFNAMNPYGPTTLGVATLGAFGAWALAEWRVLKTLRLSYTFNFERIRLFQSQLLTVKSDGTPVSAADGSFEDHALRATWRLWRGLRADLQYRLRYRANTDLENHVTLGLRGDELWRGFGAFASVGIDYDTLAGKQHNRALYSAGLSYLRPWLDVRAGFLYTDGIGSGLLFSQQTTATNGLSPTQLFPYVLETNRIAFVRGFATFWKMFAGLDVEENLEAAQLRVLAQIGATL